MLLWSEPQRGNARAEMKIFPREPERLLEMVDRQPGLDARCQERATHGGMSAGGNGHDGGVHAAGEQGEVREHLAAI